MPETLLTVLDCGHAPSAHSDIATGYGLDAEGRTYCYTCCAERDRESMIRDGRITLYLSPNDKGAWHVSNWPGSLRFAVNFRKQSRHNMARTRDDVWFTGPDGRNWHGTQYGDNSQLCYCKRLKA